MTTTHKLALASIAAATVLGTTASAIPAAEAHRGGRAQTGERFEQRLANKAAFLGLTVDELKDELETKTFREIVAEQGITEEQLIARKRARLEERWRERGVSEDSIAQRLERFDERTADGLPERGKHRRGFRRWHVK